MKIVVAAGMGYRNGVEGTRNRGVVKKLNFTASS